MEEMAFLQTIPSDRVLNGGYGDLYCIVLRDEHISLAVNHVVWRSNQRGVWPVAEEVLYRSEYAEPLLLFVRWEEFQDEPDVEIVIVSDGGVEVSWCPTRNLEDGQEYQTAYSGAWRMENDCLRLELSAGVGTSLSGSFPVYIDLSGEHLMLHWDGAAHAGLPFFADDANYMELTLSYG